MHDYQEITGACRLLMGPEILVTPEFLNCLRPSGLRSAYLDRVKFSHPDKAGFLGENEQGLAHKFIRLKEAYELLKPYVYKETETERPLSGGAGAETVRPCSAASSTNPIKDHFYSGGTPSRSLRFGQFLYYTGRISWSALIGGICRQKQFRPMMGNLAREKGYLSMHDIHSILRQSRKGEMFGAAAVRLGMLGARQVSVLLGLQAFRGNRIGHYYAEAGHVAPGDLADLLLEQYRHNRRCGHLAG